MTIHSYNVNGTKGTKVQANAELWKEPFESADIIMLQETRSARLDPLHGMLSDTHTPYVAHNPSHPGTAGFGLAAYCRTSLCSRVRVELPSEYLMWVLLTCQVGQVAMANIYVPHDAAAANQVFQLLQEQASQFQQRGMYVVMCGDFNAHIGSQEDRPCDAEGVPLPAVCARAVLAGEVVNSHGSRLLSLCQSTGLVTLTGRGPHCAEQQPVQASYVGRGAATRPDHILVSLAAAPLVQQHRVHEDLRPWDLSDHLPLTVRLTCEVVPRVPGGQDPHRPKLWRLVWDSEKSKEFKQALEQDAGLQARLARVREQAAAGDLEGAADSLHACLMEAGRTVGMKVVMAGRRVNRHRHQPWFNEECRAAKRTYRAGQQSRDALRQLKGVYQRVKRKWVAEQLKDFVANCKGQKAYMWRRMKAAVADQSQVRPDSAALLEYFAGKLAGPGISEEAGPEAEPTDELVESVVNQGTLSTALKRVRRGAAPGMPGIPVQALAAVPVRESLLVVVRAMFKAGVVPACVKNALLHSLFKRGDRTDVTSQRGIMVSSVLHKVLSNLVNDQILSHRNEQPTDPLPRQCGFLPGRSTLHNLFMLQNAVHHAVGTRQGIAVLLLDVASAYDSVSQQMLLDTLREQQFPPHLVRMVRGMYQGLQCCMLDERGGCMPAFPVGVGVKQGCPSSPLLFCYYVQPVSTELQDVRCAGTYTLQRADGSSERQVPDWGYADDFVILAFGMGGLQVLAGEASRAFLARYLQLEPRKCVLLCVNIPEGVDLQVGGQSVPRAPVDGQRYLGLQFDQSATAQTMASHRASCMASAFYATRSQLRNTDSVPTCFESIRQLLKVSVQPAGLYACEIWGLLSLRGICREPPTLPVLYALADPVEKQRCHIVKQWFRLPTGTPHLSMLHELGLEPMVHVYVRQAVRWWNCLVSMREESPYRDVLAQNVVDGVDGRVPNFACALFMVLRTLLPLSADGGRQVASRLKGLECIDQDMVEEALHKAYQQYTQSVQGTCVGYYFRQVCSHDVGEMPCWYSFALPHGTLLRVLRFRLGQHHLRVNTARWQAIRVPRMQRLCQRCSRRVTPAQVDHEDHCVLDCQAAPLVGMREVVVGMIRQVWPVAPLNSFKSFCSAIERLHERRAQRAKHKCVLFLAHCFKQAHKCWQNPGAYAVEAGEEVFQYDSFSSDSEATAEDLVVAEGEYQSL